MTGGSLMHDFGLYQVTLFAATQLGYIPIVGSMLATNFLLPPSWACVNESFVEGSAFRSMLVDWQLACSQQKVFWMFSLTDVLSTTLMFGGLLGAFLAGFFADRYGRKPLVVGTMSVVCICNVLFCVIGIQSYYIAGLLFLLVGAAAGGYMVVNLVLLVETVEHSRSRLLIVSLNGWPLGMCCTAIIASLSPNSITYHGIIAVIALAFSLLLQFLSVESVRWLTVHNHTSRASKSTARISLFNSCSSTDQMEVVDVPVKEIGSNDKGRQTDSDDGVPVSQKYSYVDLFRYKSIGVYVVALTYCSTVSSFVSFSGYLHTTLLPGDRYVNLFSMGILKMALGLIPFLFGSCLGRRPILLSSIGVASLASGATTVFMLYPHLKHTLYVSITSVLVTSALDPTWKIVHLYSTELFPTGVRNMARGICQVGARLGSVLAPIMRSVYVVSPVASMALCTSLLTTQWIVSFCVFPETNHHQLPDLLPMSPPQDTSPSHSSSQLSSRHSSQASSRLCASPDNSHS